VDELDLSLILAITPLAHARLRATNDLVDRPPGLLEGAVGVASRR
jgi:hypothetical protein